MSKIARHIVKLAAFATTGIGVGVLLGTKKSKEVCPCKKGGKVKKVIDGGSEDSFDPAIIARIKAVRRPSHLRYRTSYLKDLQRWGTKQGVMEVSSDELAKKDKQALLTRMGKVGGALANRHLPKLTRFKSTLQRKTTPEKDYYKWLRDEFKVTQVSITNTSDKPKAVRLWGANKDIGVSPPSPEQVEDHIVIKQAGVPESLGKGIHTAGVVHNPYNDFSYLTNQLSNNVTVMDDQGGVVALVQLSPSVFPGFNSPVAAAVHTDKNTTDYGKVYVAGSVACTVSVIETNFEVSAVIPVGTRPVDIKFNKVNGLFYVANFIDNTVSVIDPKTTSVEHTLASGENPKALGVNPLNGDVFIACAGDNSLWIYNQDNQHVRTIAGVGTQPSSMVFYTKREEMWVVGAESNDVTPVDIHTYQVSLPVAVGNRPFGIAHNSANNYLYVGNREDETFTIIDQDKSVRATLSLGMVSVGFAFNQSGEVLFSPKKGSGVINLIGFSQESSAVITDEDYREKRKDFQHNPALVEHTKFVFSTPNPFKSLILDEQQPSGKQKQSRVFFSGSVSPQNFLSVIETPALQGTLIDGVNSWLFTVAAYQTITILIYYRQFEMYELLAEKTPRAIGVEMSRGTPPKWQGLAQRTAINSNHKPKPI